MLLYIRTIISCLLVMLLISSTHVWGQQVHIQHKKKSTSYIQDYYKKYLVIRAYESTKFNNFRFLDGGKKVVYKPNEHNNVGIGLTYKFISLNLGLHLPFADKDLDKYGKTRQIDLQTHIYSHKFIIDFFGQLYRGFYLDNASGISYLPPDVIKRPDIRSRDISLSVMYVFNHNQFSYNAPTYQNEVQKKSAGSFIAGAGIFHTQILAGSPIIPSLVADSAFFKGNPFTNAGHTGLELNVGYGYTLVIHKYFFASAIISGGTGIGYSAISGGSSTATGSWGPGIDVNLRCAAGYNYGRYFAGINYMRLRTVSGGAYAGTWQQTDRGNFRVIAARRFKLKRSLIPESDILKAD